MWEFLRYSSRELQEVEGAAKVAEKAAETDDKFFTFQTL